jgi:hypothetical protein
MLAHRMSIPRESTLILSRQSLDQHGTGLYERFVRLAEKYQYRDLGRAVADALLYWVEAHENSDTTRPPSVHDAGPDATIQEQAAPGSIATPPPPGPEGSGESH